VNNENLQESTEVQHDKGEWTPRAKRLGKALTAIALSGGAVLGIGNSDTPVNLEGQIAVTVPEGSGLGLESAVQSQTEFGNDVHYESMITAIEDNQPEGWEDNNTYLVPLTAKDADTLVPFQGDNWTVGENERLGDPQKGGGEADDTANEGGGNPNKGGFNNNKGGEDNLPNKGGEDELKGGEDNLPNKGGEDSNLLG